MSKKVPVCKAQRVEIETSFGSSKVPLKPLI
jgi:hypothetical protein